VVQAAPLWSGIFYFGGFYEKKVSNKTESQFSESGIR